MTGPFADRLFRITFALAGGYNLAFGLWAAAWPSDFFRQFDIEPPRYPAIWACLGMVVGVYGLLYWHAAWKLESAWPIIAVGLVGKVLGPIGMAMSFGDDWPLRLGMICVWNDLIWWLPFGLFLMRGTAVGRRLAALAPWYCAAIHAVGLAAMALVLRGGMLTEPDAADRARYIVEHTMEWTVGWAVWMLAATSIVGFYTWWGGRIAKSQTEESPSRIRYAVTIGVLLAAIGMVCDLSGEAIAALVLVEQAGSAGEMTSTAWHAARYLSAERAATLLTAGAANALYTLGGVVLMLATPDLPNRVRRVMWGTWLAGLLMAISAIVNATTGMVVATVVLFPLLIGWVGWMGIRWRRP